jgi:flagellar biosynthesis component FlhA
MATFNERRRTNLPLLIELSPAVGALRETVAAEPSWRLLEAAVEDLLDGLGLSGIVRVSVRVVETGRAVGVRIHGRIQAYPPILLQQAWLAVAPPQLRPLGIPAAVPGQPPIEGQWLVEYLTGVAAERQPDWSLAVAFIHELVLEVLRRNPTCLLGQAQATEYREQALILDPASPQPSEARLALVMRHLLSLGVSLADRATVFGAVSDGDQLEESPEATAEAAYARLRSPRIEVSAHPDTTLTLLGDHAPRPGSRRLEAASLPDELKTAWSEVEAKVFGELGIRFPPLEWSADARIPAGMISVRINDVDGVRTPALGPDQVLVMATPEDLARRDVPCVPIQDPRSGARVAAVAREHVARLTDAVLQTVSPLGFVCAIVLGAAARHYGRMLALDVVDDELDQLGDYFPDLVSAARACLHPEDLTRAMRALVEEGLSVRDSRGILERLLQFSTIPADPDLATVLDDRLPVSPGDSFPRWQRYVRFLRLWLRPTLAYNVTHASFHLYAYELDDGLETWAGTLPSQHSADLLSPSDEVKAEALRQALRLGLAQPQNGEGVTPVVLVANGARAAVRWVLAPEFPQIPVLADAEIAPVVVPTWLGRLSMPEPKRVTIV